MKRSQVTIYVIIGLVVLILAGFVIIKIRQNIEVVPEDDKEIKPVLDYVEACIEESTIEAMELIGKQGLVYPNVYLASTDNVKISYFYFKGRNYFPKKRVIEDQLSLYLRQDLGECLDEFSLTRFVIEQNPSSLNTDVKINEDNIQASIDYPIIVKQGDEEYNRTEFTALIDSGFMDIYRLSERIIDQTIEDPEWINLDLIENPKMNVKLIKIEENIIVYEITDVTGLDDEEYTYRFGVKYAFI